MEQAIQLLQQSLDTSFLDAYIENGENILDDFQVRVLDGVPNPETVKQLETLYHTIKKIDLAPEDVRRLSQLLLLKGTRKEQLQANHQLTPDGIGFLFVYLVEQLTNKSEPLKILDPASGMGNLLLTVLLNLETAGYKVSGYGVDIDETLLAVSSVNNAWSQANIQLFHQDGLQDLLLDPVDLALSDLPIGYYPNDERAKGFAAAAEEGHSYAHHLLMEQAMKYVKPAGFGLFLIPTNILETEQSEFFKNWLTKNVYLQGMIQLPDELFKSEQSRKSILLVQNKGADAEQVKEVLLAKLASLKWQLYQMPNEEVIAKGIVERIGLKDSIFTIKYGEGQKYEVIVDIDNHEVAVKMLLDQLIDLNILGSYDEITGVGHRVVAGGEEFKDSVVITDEVLEKIEALSELAPLHNPANAMGIKAFKHILPEIISVAVFDTSFHTTMPEHNYLYSVPREYYEKFAARKYAAWNKSSLCLSTCCRNVRSSN